MGGCVGCASEAWGPRGVLCLSSRPVQALVLGDHGSLHSGACVPLAASCHRRGRGVLLHLRHQQVVECAPRSSWCHLLRAGSPGGSGAQGSKFVVSASLPVTIFAVAAIDPYNKHQGRYKSGFETLGWEAVPVSGFLLTPLAVHMGCWRRKLAAGDTLEVPHWSGLFGSIAVKVASS